MAERDYMHGDAITPIGEMSTRQLRKYIRERVEEAQKRVDSIKNVEDASAAFQNQLAYVQSFGSGRGGNLKKDTSRISKAEMVEYAYAVRDLNMLDTESKYARDTDYKENKARYEAFIQERTREDNPNKADREYWEQFKTEKGNVSKKGYQEYKNFINFIRNIDEVMATYGYETIKDKYYDETDPEEQAYIADLLIETYEENKGLGLTPGDLLDEFQKKLNEHKKDIAKQKKAAAGINPTGKKNKGKSGTNVQTKTAGKMKNGRIREKQTTEKA